MKPILARCGYRCDLCPAYRENIRGPEDQQRVSDGWFRYFGFRIPPEAIRCDGCRDARPRARRIDAACPVRPCAIDRECDTCATCPEFGCARLEQRTVTRAWVEQRLGAVIAPADYRCFVRPYLGRPRLARLRRQLAPPS